MIELRSAFGPIPDDLWENDNLRLPLDRGRWSDEFNQMCERLIAEANFDRDLQRGDRTLH